MQAGLFYSDVVGRENFPKAALERFFEPLPLGTALFDCDLRLLRCNLTWAAWMGQYAGLPASQFAPGKKWFELLPQDEAVLRPLLQQALAGEVVRLEEGAVHPTSQPGPAWRRVLAPVLENGKVTAILDVVVNKGETTPTDPAQQAAFEKLKESEQALRSLVENARHFSVYQIAVDPHNPQNSKLVFSSPSICEIVGADDPAQFEGWQENLHPDDRERVYQANLRSWQYGETYNEITRIFNRKKNRWVWVHTISNPVMDASGRIVHFDGMVIDITDQMNLREEERLRQAAEGLRDVLRVINSNRPLTEILDTIARQALLLLQASSTMIRLLKPEDDLIYTAASCQLPPDFELFKSLPLIRAPQEPELQRHQPVVVADVQAAYQSRLDDPKLKDDMLRSWLGTFTQHARSLLKTPIFNKETLWGEISFHFEQPRQFSQEDLNLAMTLADQAALAIENARLIDQVKETAAMNERSRLARELHDAVTQTLFSTSLTAEVVPLIWDKNPVEGRKKLEEVRELTRGALAEMRTLLMELRPDALLDARLKDLLNHLTNAFIARARVSARFSSKGEGELPPEVKIAFYRIAQEALNNIVRHSTADRVEIFLEMTTEGALLAVEDNGQGFDPAANLKSDHHGLRIMQERAEQVGADFKLFSCPEQGVQIVVRWPAIHPERELE
jgi:two-component system nitrate/nitrite sensor histidine kinase NarX